MKRKEEEEMSRSGGQKSEETARERTESLNHSSAGTLCAACVQFQHVMKPDILHPPFVWFRCSAVMEVTKCCLEADDAF